MSVTKARAKKPRTIAARIRHLEPCRQAREWAKKYTSPARAWKECQRGDWMLWLVGNVSCPPESDARKKLVLCACECARLALPIYAKRYPKDPRVLQCIETAERWANGNATIEELRRARYAAYAAAAYAADAYAADAYAAYAAYAADSAAYAAAAAAARNKVLAKCADIVRKHYPKPPQIKKP